MNMMLDPKDLGTARGIVRRGFETARTMTARKTEMARINAAIGPRSSIHNHKGRVRVMERLRKEFGPCGLVVRESEVKPHGIAISYWAAVGDDFDLCLGLLIAAHWKIEIRTFTVGSLSKHAAIRFTQRTDGHGLNEMILAAFRAATIASNVREHADITHLPPDAVFLVPVGYGLAAVVGAHDSTVITFNRVDKLGPLRQAVIEGVEPKSLQSLLITTEAYHPHLLTPEQRKQIVSSADVLRRTKEFAARCDGEFVRVT